MNIIEQFLDPAGILTITLNRPEKLNALSDELLKKLQSILAQVKLDDNIKALLITGSGAAFCAGADIKRLLACDAHSGYQFACEGQAIFQSFATLGKPSMAAVNGYAFGGGCELALATTLRIAVATAKFCQPEVKLGVIPGYGGTQRLARLIGKGRALDLCLTGRAIDATTALQWGLINAVVDKDDLLNHGKALLQSILSMGPLAVTGIIEVIEHGYDLPLAESMHLEALHFAKVCASRDKQEGVQAFLDKRKPQFIGA